MNYRLFFAACCLLLVASLALNLPGSPSVAQQADAVRPIPGRYDMEIVEQGGGSFTVIVCDTHTGQCWSRRSTGGKEWHDYGSPVDQK